MYKKREADVMEKEKDFREKWTRAERCCGFWPRQVLQGRERGSSHMEAGRRQGQGWKTDAEEKGSRNKWFLLIREVILFSTFPLPLPSQAGQVKKRKEKTVPAPGELKSRETRAQGNTGYLNTQLKACVPIPALLQMGPWEPAGTTAPVSVPPESGHPGSGLEDGAAQTSHAWQRPQARTNVGVTGARWTYAWGVRVTGNHRGQWRVTGARRGRLGKRLGK